MCVHVCALLPFLCVPGRRPPAYEIAAAAVLTGERSGAAGAREGGAEAGQREEERGNQDGQGGEGGERRKVGASMPPMGDASALLR